MSLAISEVVGGDQSVALVVTGVVDDDTVEQFERGIDAAVGAGLRQLVLDLTACRLASAGLAALVRQQQRLQTRSTVVDLVATDVEMLWLLEIVGATSRSEVHASLDAALGSHRLQAGFQRRRAEVRRLVLV